jgi:hypothetical protein
MVTKKSAKKEKASSMPVTPCVSQPLNAPVTITIKLKKGYTMEDLLIAITPDFFKCMKAGHKLGDTVGVVISEVIPKNPNPGNG